MFGWEEGAGKTVLEARAVARNCRRFIQPLSLSLFSLQWWALLCGGPAISKMMIHRVIRFVYCFLIRNDLHPINDSPARIMSDVAGSGVGAVDVAKFAL